MKLTKYLCHVFDEKRYVLDDGIHTLAYFHKDSVLQVVKRFKKIVTKKKRLKKIVIKKKRLKKIVKKFHVSNRMNSVKM